MTQVCEESAYELEVEEPKQNASQEVNKQEVKESLGDLNPRYYEHVRTPKKALQELWAKYSYKL